MAFTVDGPQKRSVAGVNISTTTYDEVVQYCRNWIAQRRAEGGQARSHYICVTSVHGVIESRDHPDIRDTLNGADIATPDGMPLVWALRSFGVSQQERVYGPTLMLHLCRDAAAHGHRVFLYGSTSECLGELRQRLVNTFPGLQICGSYSPPFRALTPEEDAGIDALIRESGADLVFVGISTPKQERWMRARVETLSGVVMIGVGAAFDFHAGRVRQAPAWIQRAGLEWFFRLAMEPARLWRRYVLVTPRFLPLWGAQWLKSRLADGSAADGSRQAGLTAPQVGTECE